MTIPGYLIYIGHVRYAVRLQFCYFRGRIVKYHVNDICFVTIDGSNRHGAVVFSLIRSIAYSNYAIRVTVNRKFEISV